MKSFRAHPDYLDPPVPEHAAVGDLHLEVLGPAIVEEDYDAVMESEARLTGLFGGDWPRGLTLEDNHVDLAWHLREFEAARSFAWVVRDAAGRYLGCCYLFPALGQRGFAHAWIWFRSGALDPSAEARASAALFEWLHGISPAGMQIDLHVPGAD